MRTPSLMLWVFVPVTCLAAFETASAQSSPSRLQLGAQVSAVRLTVPQTTSTGLQTTNAGFGANVSYDLFRCLSADGDFTFFPDDDVPVPGGPQLRLRHDRQRVEAFGGLKAGIRRDRVGLFAKVRPGFERVINSGIVCTGEMCALVLLARPVYLTEFALDLGGVVELYPSARTFVRLDLGSTTIRHRREAAPPCRDCTTWNLASSAGIGWRF